MSKIERVNKWLDTLGALARVIALLAAALAGAIAERDVGVLPAVPQEQPNALSSK